MNMELIDLCIAERNPDEMDYALNEGYYEEIKQDAKKLDLQGQIDLANECLRKLRRPNILSSPLSKDELVVWQAFLPTSYRGTIVEPVRGSRALRSYLFDLIPKHIRQKWMEWDNDNTFDEFEIRTEEESLDPALFGIRDGKYWLLARWGASDERLLSFDEIKKRLRERLRVDRRDMAIVAGVFLMASLLFFWPVVSVLCGVKPPIWLGMMAPTTFALVFAIVVWKERDERMWSILNSSN